MGWKTLLLLGVLAFLGGIGIAALQEASTDPDDLNQNMTTRSEVATPRSDKQNLEDVNKPGAPTLKTKGQTPGYQPIHADFQGQAWVAVERAPRHTCSSQNCGMVGNLHYRESAVVLDQRDGWSRITESYPARCINGRSEYISSGNTSCETSNGIVANVMSEWVDSRLLTEIRPRNPSETASSKERLVSQSDDFLSFRKEFLIAAEKLISSGRCSAQDFTKAGGWIKSTNRGSGWYFTYCNGFNDQVYLNANTGRIE